jgi:DNA invertase Pin-like site-specific DNA recombinase
MKIEMKRPNKQMADNIETMLNDFAKISTIARTLKTQMVTVYRYISYLQYTKVMVSDVELKMIINHRKARKASLASPAQSTPAPGITHAATPVLGA